MDRRQRSQLILFLLLGFGSLAWAEPEECNDARDRVQICCLNPSACLSSDQREKQNEVEMYRDSASGNLSINQAAKNKRNALMMDRIQDELNSAYRKKCSDAITGCLKACKNVDADMIEECQKSKTELEKLIKKDSPTPQNESESQIKELERVDEATKSMPSAPAMPSPPSSNSSPMAPTPEPGDDPISTQR